MFEVLWQSKSHLLPQYLQLHHFLLAHLVAQALGHEEVLRFVKKHLVPSLAKENKPLLSFEAKITKVEASTLGNMFDVETCDKSKSSCSAEVCDGIPSW